MQSPGVVRIQPALPTGDRWRGFYWRGSVAEIPEIVTGNQHNLFTDRKGIAHAEISLVDDKSSPA